MGSGQSVRATHFTRPPPSSVPDEPQERHISISNKMVERLVEDATLAGGAASAEPVKPKPRSQADYKDKIYTEKIKCLDESHSEKNKITVNDLNTLVRRIEMRTPHVSDAVCSDYQQRIIDCYKEAQEAGEVIRCWNTIGDFKQCVRRAGAERLRARTRADAAELARRERRVARARDHALRDLS